MVCFRCILAVQAVLEKLNIAFASVELGRAKLAENLGAEQYENLNRALQYYKLELLDDKRKILVERIKILVLEMLDPSNDIRINLSAYLSTSLNYEYNYLSNVFSEVEGSTIERFYIESRIERVKELIVYESLKISEIAYRLNYSSVSHLCNQFKKVTGQTPSAFKRLCATEDFVWRKV